MGLRRSALAAALALLASAPAARAQTGELVATDARWHVGSGLRIEGPIGALLLLVSGRPAALAELSGPGAGEVPALFGLEPPPDVSGPTSPGSPTSSIPSPPTDPGGPS